VKDDAQSAACAGADAADAVAEVDAIRAAGALNGAMAHGEGDGIAQAERDDFRAGLHAGALFGEDEFAAGEVFAWFSEEESDLDGEDVVAIDILVEAVVVAWTVLQEQRRGAELAGLVAAFEKGGVFVRELDIDVHGSVPAVRYRGEMTVKGSSEGLDNGRERVIEIFVFAAAEPVARHDNAGAEEAVIGVERGKGAAIAGRENGREHGAALLVEFGEDVGPVERIDHRDTLAAGDGRGTPFLALELASKKRIV
jgi:hypothetical protein